MLLVEIGTASVISAYFYRHITSDPIEGQPVQLSDYLFVFGCGLVFWLLVMLRAKLHDSGDRQADIRKVAKLAKLIAPITTLNLCGCLLAPFMKLPLLVRFLVLFQVSSNLALLLIWAFLSLKECMILLDAHTQQQQKSSPEPQAVQQQKPSPEPQAVQQQKPSPEPAVVDPKRPLLPNDVYQEVLARLREKLSARWEEQDRLKAGGKVDEAGGSGSGHGSGASGREENRGRYVGNDGGGGAGGGGDRGASGSGHGSGASGSGGGSEGGDRGSDGCGDRGASGSGHGSGASGSGGGNEGGDRGSDGGGDRGESGSGHGSGASGSGGGSEGGDRGRDGGLVDPESGERGTKTERANEMIKLSITLTAQTTGTLMGFHLIPTSSSSSKVLLVVALMDQLVAYLCGVTGILLRSNKPEDSKAANIFAGIGLVCYTLGYILMIAMYVAMYVPWYSVLIIVLLFGVVWLILFWNGLKARATEVWNYLKGKYTIYKELHRDAI